MWGRFLVWFIVCINYQLLEGGKRKDLKLRSVTKYQDPSKQFMKFAEAYLSSPVNAAAKFVETRKPVTIMKEINKTKVRKCVYFCEMFSLPSLIKLYRMSILLFIPINMPTEIINSKSNTMVASITVESLA